MSHPSDEPEDTSISGADVVNKMLFMQALDPRRIECVKYADRFLKKLQRDGFLVKNTTPDEYQHLIGTLAFAICQAVRADREDRVTL